MRLLISSLVSLVAGDCGRGEATAANPAIGEVKAEEALRIAQSLRGCDGVTKVLDHVEDLRLLGSLHSFHLRLPLLIVVLWSVRLRLVGFAQKKLALFCRGLVELNQGHQNRQPDAGKPALASTTRHLLQFEGGQEFYFD